MRRLALSTAKRRAVAKSSRFFHAKQRQKHAARRLRDRLDKFSTSINNDPAAWRDGRADIAAIMSAALTRTSKPILLPDFVERSDAAARHAVGVIALQSSDALANDILARSCGFDR